MSASIDALEAFTNAAIGLLISWAATYTLLPVFWGLHPSAASSAGITGTFFVLSFARAWIVRRTFRRLA